eukprot:g6806.t1 g6806   contig23:1249718-1252378(-)
MDQSTSEGSASGGVLGVSHRPAQEEGLYADVSSVHHHRQHLHSFCVGDFARVEKHVDHHLLASSSLVSASGIQFDIQATLVGDSDNESDASSSLPIEHAIIENLNDGHDNYHTPMVGDRGSSSSSNNNNVTAERGFGNHSNSDDDGTNNNNEGDNDNTQNTNNNDEQQSRDNTPSQTTAEETSQQLLFSCQCDSARTIATLLSCLRRVLTPGNNSSISSSCNNNYNRSQTQASSSAAGGGVPSLTQNTNKIQHATVYAGPNGLTFHVQHGLAKQAQCSVDMPKGLFREYFVGEEEVWLEDDSDLEDGDAEGGGNGGSSGAARGKTKETIQGGEFGINLTTVLECFSILSRNKPASSMGNSGKGGSGNNGGGTNYNSGEYASLDKVPLCMSYDRGTALFHLEFLDEGNLGGVGGGCLVTCEIPGVAVADDVDDGPDSTVDGNSGSINNSGLASAFRSSPLLARAILYSDALQAAVAELYDVPGASVVQVALSKAGMELGTVGPRSEVWVNVPYHRHQGGAGIYVGMECYQPTSSIIDEPSAVRRYPLGAFLSGMRGLEIGCETCISVNSRGMMAIQHQVTRDRYHDAAANDGSGGVRPSFVDFIMTCIENEDEEEEDEQSRSRVNESIQRPEMNTTIREDASKTQSKRHNEAARSKDRSLQSSPEKDSDGDDNGQDVPFDDDNGEADATKRILGELEIDSDLLNTKRGTAKQGRQGALEDLRRRRQMRKTLEPRLANENKADDYSDNDEVNAAGRKRRSGSASPSTSRKAQRAEDPNDSDESEQSHRNHRSSGGNVRASQSQSDEDDDSEPEDSLDVTTEIPQIFSKSSSMNTSRHGSRHSRGGTATMDSGDYSEGDVSEEPKMMYGDTKLEGFTQDGYGIESEDSM